jgi:hypothetical protein
MVELVIENRVEMGVKPDGLSVYREPHNVQHVPEVPAFRPMMP